MDLIGLAHFPRRHQTNVSNPNLLNFANIRNMNSDITFSRRAKCIRVGRRRCARRGTVLTIEMLLLIPLLLVIVFAIAQYSMMLMATQAISASASVGVRQAILPGATNAGVENAVRSALAGWSFQDDNDLDVQIYVEDMPHGAPAVENAVTGEDVTVSVSVPATRVAPNALLLVGISIDSTALRSTFTMRKE